MGYNAKFRTNRSKPKFFYNFNFLTPAPQLNFWFDFNQNLIIIKYILLFKNEPKLHVKFRFDIHTNF